MVLVPGVKVPAPLMLPPRFSVFAPGAREPLVSVRLPPTFMVPVADQERVASERLCQVSAGTLRAPEPVRLTVPVSALNGPLVLLQVPPTVSVRLLPFNGPLVNVRVPETVVSPPSVQAPPTPFRV